MKTLLEVEFEGSTVSIAIDDSHGETFLVGDPIPLTTARAIRIARGLLDWAHPEHDHTITLTKKEPIK